MNLKQPCPYCGKETPLQRKYCSKKHWQMNSVFGKYTTLKQKRVYYRLYTSKWYHSHKNDPGFKEKIQANNKEQYKKHRTKRIKYQHDLYWASPKKHRKIKRDYARRKVMNRGGIALK